MTWLNTHIIIRGLIYYCISQYLSGVDVPLRTNLEMVQIFKQFNGSVHAEVLRYQRSRLGRKKYEVGSSEKETSKRYEQDAREKIKREERG